MTRCPRGRLLPLLFTAYAVVLPRCGTACRPVPSRLCLHPAAVPFAGKDADEVDNDYFLCPVPITSHDGMLRTDFPVENRLLPQVRSGVS